MGYSIASASNNVHAGPGGIFNQLAAMGENDVILAGRSNAGLLEPGQHAALSLTHITHVLTGKMNGIDEIIEFKVLIALRDEVPEALYKASRKLQQEDAEIRKAAQRQISRAASRKRRSPRK
jgi:hypothetical protein